MLRVIVKVVGPSRDQLVHFGYIVEDTLGLSLGRAIQDLEIARLLPKTRRNTPRQPLATYFFNLSGYS